MEEQLELGDAEVELALEDREADEQAAEGDDRTRVEGDSERGRPPRARRSRAALARPALGEQHA